MSGDTLTAFLVCAACKAPCRASLPPASLPPCLPPPSLPPTKLVRAATLLLCIPTNIPFATHAPGCWERSIFFSFSLPIIPDLRGPESGAMTSTSVHPRPARTLLGRLSMYLRASSTSSRLLVLTRSTYTHEDERARGEGSGEGSHWYKATARWVSEVMCAHAELFRRPVSLNKSSAPAHTHSMTHCTLLCPVACVENTAEYLLSLCAPPPPSSWLLGSGSRSVSSRSLSAPVTRPALPCPAFPPSPPFAFPSLPDSTLRLLVLLLGSGSRSVSSPLTSPQTQRPVHPTSCAPLLPRPSSAWRPGKTA